MVFDSFSMGLFQNFPRCSKNNPFQRWIIFLKNYHSHPQSHHDYEFFFMTQKILEIDVMVYNMTKSPKTYKNVFPSYSLQKINNGGIKNKQISKINNVEKHKNKRKQLNFFCKISEN